MGIETKYDIGQEVWYMEYNKVWSRVVTAFG